MKLRVCVVVKSGRGSFMESRRSRNQVAVKREFGFSSAQQAVSISMRAAGITACSFDQIPTQILRLVGRNALNWRYFHGELRRFCVALKVRIDDGASPDSVKFALASQSNGQGRRSSFAVADQSQIAQQGIEFVEISGFEIDVQVACAGQRVSAQVTVG